MSVVGRKKILNYRANSGEECCGTCRRFVHEQSIRFGPGGKPKAFGSRCRIFGVKNGRGYEIDPSNVCDEHDAFF